MAYTVQAQKHVSWCWTALWQPETARLVQKGGQHPCWFLSSCNSDLFKGPLPIYLFIVCLFCVWSILPSTYRIPILSLLRCSASRFRICVMRWDSPLGAPSSPCSLQRRGEETEGAELLKAGWSHLAPSSAFIKRSTCKGHGACIVLVNGWVGWRHTPLLTFLELFLRSGRTVGSLAIHILLCCSSGAWIASRLCRVPVRRGFPSANKIRALRCL